MAIRSKLQNPNPLCIDHQGRRPLAFVSVKAFAPRSWHREAAAGPLQKSMLRRRGLGCLGVFRVRVLGFKGLGFRFWVLRSRVNAAVTLNMQ